MLGEAVYKLVNTLLGVCNVLVKSGSICTLYLHCYAKHQHRYDRTDGAKACDTEGVVTVIARKLGHRHTCAYRHNKGNGHRACGYSSRVEGEAKKALVHEEGQYKGHHLKADHYGGKTPAKNDTHNRNSKENSYSNRYGKNKQHIFKAVYLLGKDNQVGL